MEIDRSSPSGHLRNETHNCAQLDSKDSASRTEACLSFAHTRDSYRTTVYADNPAYLSNCNILIQGRPSPVDPCHRLPLSKGIELCCRKQDYIPGFSASPFPCRKNYP